MTSAAHPKNKAIADAFRDFADRIERGGAALEMITFMTVGHPGCPSSSAIEALYAPTGRAIFIGNKEFMANALEVKERLCPPPPANSTKR